MFLAQKETGLSRSQVRQVVAEGDVVVNGVAPKVSQKLKEGDVVELTLKPAKDAIAVAFAGIEAEPLAEFDIAHPARIPAIGMLAD